MNQRSGVDDLVEPTAASTHTIKWAIAAALVGLIALIAFAPRGNEEGALAGALEHAGVASPAVESVSGYRGPGPRFAEPQGGLTAYEEAQAWANLTEEENAPVSGEETF